MFACLNVALKMGVTQVILGAVGLYVVLSIHFRTLHTLFVKVFSFVQRLRFCLVKESLENGMQSCTYMPRVDDDFDVFEAIEEPTCS